MCVPISFTSWCITSSIQQSGLSSATAALEAERFKRWELVWRSALKESGKKNPNETGYLHSVDGYGSKD